MIFSTIVYDRRVYDVDHENNNSRLTSSYMATENQTTCHEGFLNSNPTKVRCKILQNTTKYILIIHYRFLMIVDRKSKFINLSTYAGKLCPLCLNWLSSKKSPGFLCFFSFLVSSFISLMRISKIFSRLCFYVNLIFG